MFMEYFCMGIGRPIYFTYDNIFFMFLIAEKNQIERTVVTWKNPSLNSSAYWCIYPS